MGIFAVVVQSHLGLLCDLVRLLVLLCFVQCLRLLPLGFYTDYNAYRNLENNNELKETKLCTNYYTAPSFCSCIIHLYYYMLPKSSACGTGTLNVRVKIRWKIKKYKIKKNATKLQSSACAS